MEDNDLEIVEGRRQMAKGKNKKNAGGKMQNAKCKMQKELEGRYVLRNYKYVFFIVR